MYLRHTGRYGKPLILATGMATLGEIEAAIDVLETAGIEVPIAAVGLDHRLVKLLAVPA